MRYGLIGRPIPGCPETPLQGSDRCKSHPRIAAANTEGSDFDHLACETCHKQTGEETMLVCSDDYGHGCNRGYHSDCLRPPLPEHPRGAWFCAECTKVLSQGQSGKNEVARDPIADDTRLEDTAIRRG